jgi:hypothetical protein
MYCFLAKVEPWADNLDPPAPQTDTTYQKQVFKNMFVAKMVTASNISPVIRRVDWSSTTYDYYRDDIDMNAVDANGYPLYTYYVKNKYDQVFKCLCNGATEDNPTGLTSTEEPFFEPGSYQTNGIFQKTDGFKWKYMYTIDTGLKVKFMDDNWMPVSVGQNTPNPVQTDAGAGSVDVINVLNGGSGYDPALSPVTVVVTLGDGTGLTATATVTDGVVTDVTVATPGGNYSYATVAISSGVGSGAVLYAPTSPIGGHGFDTASELGARHVMITAEFNGSENGYIPVDVDFHQIGLLINPTSKTTYPNPANSSVYKTTTDVLVSAGPTIYENDEFVYQYDTNGTVTFSARVLYHNTTTNELNLINTYGTPTLNTQLFGESSTAQRTLLSYNTPELYPFSGYIAYIENRAAIQRSSDGIEQFRFVLGY